MRWNGYLIRSTFAGALGGLLFGFDTAVISGTTHQLTEVFHLTPHLLGITVSIALWGTTIGALSAGALGQRLGAREALRVMAVLYLLSALGSALAWSWPALLFFRLLGGLGIGGSSVLGPVYIAEMAPAKLRGRLVGLFQINVVAGILIAYASNYGLASLALGGLEWRWQLGVATLPALLFFALLFGIPRSSRWLVTQNRLEEARAVLEAMGTPETDAELREIVAAVERDRSTQGASLFRAKYKLPIFLAVSIGFFNQLSGINAILYYLNDIFAAAGYSRLSADKQAVIVGAMNFVATLLAMSMIDKLGRKTLLLIGALGTAVALGGVAAIFSTHSHESELLGLLLTFIFFFSISQGAVIWVYIGEVFPSLVRSKGQGLGAASHWVMNATIAAIFPWIATRSHAVPFAFFAAMMLVQFFVVLLVYPETKGASLEQLQEQLGLS
jgi:MFS transporter, SP family, arabinose:H+ symporter